ncbi:hypothetical protein [Streptomyces sp. NPDC019937]|uniref:hypothetical protein n=1 Tax=Streptomyces sp. NPDC019937 TaxID=3154787 RepID=UPI0033E5D813
MATNGLRLLPWTTPDGLPCYLSPADTNSRLSRRADEIEALQLSMAAELLGHARMLLDERKVDIREIRFLAERLCEALRDVLRVAESRGARLRAADDENGYAEPNVSMVSDSASDSDREPS